MASLSYEAMIKKLEHYWTERQWNMEKLKNMTTGQQFAIYFSYMRKGWPKSETKELEVAVESVVSVINVVQPKVKTKLKKGVMAGQLSLW